MTDLLQQAIQHHRAGEFSQAESLYRAILQTQPSHPDANHNLGVLAVAVNKTELALPFFKLALETNPNHTQFWLSYIDALIKTEQFDLARDILKTGLERGLRNTKLFPSVSFTRFAFLDGFRSEKVFVIISIFIKNLRTD
ncbi:MAG: tetratricopeptide repeat protein [Methylococcaceae bacterium]